MWDCAACGWANEDHALFCASCAGLRAELRPLSAARGALAEPPPEADEPPPPVPPLKPVRWTFIPWWIVATAVGEVVAVFLKQFAYQYLLSMPGSWEAGSARHVLPIVTAVLGSAIIGGAETAVLALAVPARRWIAWIPASAAAAGVAALLLSFLREISIPAGSTIDLLWLLHSSVFGALVGAAQMLVLRSRFPGAPWAAWILLTGVSAVVESMLWIVLVPQGPWGGWIFELMRIELIGAAASGLLTGVGLFFLLRRALRGAGARVAEGG